MDNSILRYFNRAILIYQNFFIRVLRYIRTPIGRRWDRVAKFVASLFLATNARMICEIENIKRSNL